MKRLSAALIAFVWAFASTSALATDGWYGSVRGGAVFVMDADVGDPSGTLQAANAQVGFDPGFGVAGAIGHGWHTDSSLVADFRVEGEGFYRYSQGDELTVLGVGFPAGGDVSALGGMLNGYFDFRTGSRWSPYIGAGVGAANVEIEDASVAGTAIGSEDDLVFAYQGIAGLNYQFSPQTALQVEYRFFATEDLEFSGGLTSQYRSHNLFVGLLLQF